MSHHTPLPLAFLVALAVGPASGLAQDTPKPDAPRAEKAEKGVATATLRLNLVITRFQGEKKIASLPYAFVVTAGGDWTRMRMGVDTPIPITPPSPDGKGPVSFQYKNVGTKIDCRATERGQAYQVYLAVENSSALTGPGASVEGAPLFRSFETKMDLFLHDGQTVQTVASTDPVTGEVVKIDVTMNVVK
jgi:hypothetical protein